MSLSLTSRVTMFFLGVLACVLIGFAGTFYFLARTYLYRQVNERLEAGLDTLVAVAEVTDSGVEWEPATHSIFASQHPANRDMIWWVRDEKGRVLERAHDLAAPQLNFEGLPP